MNYKRMCVGVLALSALAFGGAAVPAPEPGGVNENEDQRETKLVRLKLPAMV